ncbi:MAG TPA: 2Fe-2S iron-sulfur cluster-binding protein, partial [Desulfobacteria bacterium]|nr:2Fe-2S iron-sulfur cluster-binding protein [Desulfobacteria bacterium]
MADVTLTINGQKVTAAEGITVLEAAKQIGIDIPTFCYEKALTAPGACRICVVEIKGMRNLPPSCVTAVAPGMEVETDSPAVVEARKTILELLVANHPLDCLTCEKSGNCKLQDYCYRYGITSPTRFEGDKHEFGIDDSNPYIYRDLNKCILCGKCVATCRAVSDRNVLDFAYRGFNTKIATFMDADLKDSACVYCNRCVTICPVGAIVDKTMMGKGRGWELDKKEVTCTFCDSGCKFDVNFKDGKFVGVTAKSPDQGRPLCLKGRLGIELIYNPDKSELPLIKKDGEFVETSWEEALG